MNSTYNKPKLSIITIVYNDVKHLENTILSVTDQTYNNIEYIIIDGASNDGTVDLIKKHASKVSKWSSEPDNGIYDAMNKGLKAATGDYVLFINSGDKLYSKSILTTIFDKIDLVLPDVIYGETMIVNEAGAEIGLRRLKAPEKLSWKSLRDGMLVCHQSFLVKREIAPNYNLKYRLAADYDWMLRSLKKATNIHNSKEIVAAFLDGGVSKNNIKKSLKERFSIMVLNYGFVPTVLRHLLIAVKFCLFFLKNKRF